MHFFSLHFFDIRCGKLTRASHVKSTISKEIFVPKFRLYTVWRKIKKMHPCDLKVGLGWNPASKSTNPMLKVRENSWCFLFVLLVVVILRSMAHFAFSFISFRDTLLLSLFTPIPIFLSVCTAWIVSSVAWTSTVSPFFLLNISKARDHRDAYLTHLGVNIPPPKTLHWFPIRIYCTLYWYYVFICLLIVPACLEECDCGIIFYVRGSKSPFP